jgi:hypothetical protein
VIREEKTVDTHRRTARDLLCIPVRYGNDLRYQLVLRDHGLESRMGYHDFDEGR